MPTNFYKKRLFDDRPDRIDYRDQLYRPPLVALPARYLAQVVTDKYLFQYQRDNLMYGHFDNAVQVITQLLESIIGVQFKCPIEILQGC